MWIRTQNKQRIINSDQIIDIFVSKTETRIIAETTKEDVIVLGEYKDRDTCLLVLDELSGAMKMKCIVYDMSTQEVIDD